MHHVLSDYVFGKHEDLALVSLYDKNPKKYSVSLGQHLTRLKRIYGDHVKDLGNTGAGLDPDAVIPGSDIANKIESIRQDFPFWDNLHAFWRELPNYNPIAVTNSVAGAECDVEALVNSINKKVVESLEAKDSSGESSDEENNGSGIEDAGLLAQKAVMLSSPSDHKSFQLISKAPFTAKKGTSTLPLLKMRKSDLLDDFREIEVAEIA
ncbi:hypothetical protein M422DRAFT_45548 [Sphaerobolus stellatus SS14]|uniref:Uncharacterized protein n=1 Tax=Sphaerobolus stellatus (strain SS14) TaxID=990650 RepID=A0A0C9VIM7_SPHS4|nr:hypothetical protein M422DRAFT_45548 [Sphaerobolus stellatus SS14]